ncbi:protein of unknown function [Maridesulfovibrio hydrothermalis AM13 = DSM 14728]|uniref:Uncharacterized protein n=1 Tax=Maridesulfovibrio hydrothermalis AM13 = DSM 14728 TaxID=1121451 RepID=L0R6G2_9BACT|nr:protein of unknown function [Maridesulfovibrio hydrothermalis AM13 = DSM 14728]
MLSVIGVIAVHIVSVIAGTGTAKQRDSGFGQKVAHGLQKGAVWCVIIVPGQIQHLSR